MRSKAVSFFKKNNLVSEREVDSLIVSTFVEVNEINVIENKLILSLLEFNFYRKSTLMEELSEIICKENTRFDFEGLIQLFEFVISPNTRVVNGAVYTPQHIRDFILEKVFDDFDSKRVLNGLRVADLSCGCGAFLIDSAKLLKKKTGLPYFNIFKDYIYGSDIQEYAIDRSKILLSLFALSEGEDRNFDFNLVVTDALYFNWQSYCSKFSGFNIIVGNPPYVAAKHMTTETRAQLATMQTCKVGNPDLYIPFFEIGIEHLAIDGKLGFITMNSFFKSLNARNLRKYFKNKSLEFQLVDFGADQVFQSRNTYTCICVITNKFSENIEYARIASNKLSGKISFSKISYQKLDSHNGWNLYKNDLINKIENIGTPLGVKYTTSHGLATLRNEVYIFTPYSECKHFYYLITKEGKRYPIEKSICKPVINSNKLSRKSSFKALKEQLIFPYTNEANPKILNETFLLKNYPKLYVYLQDHRDLLSLRDKGKGKYQEWYAFGRTQGLEKIKHKMFFPKYSDITPHFMIHSDPETYFYNGQAFLGGSIRELKVLKKILESQVFWFYICSTSKPYTSGYYSLNGIYIRNFGICDLTKEEEDYILSESSEIELNRFFEKKYSLDKVQWLS